MKKARIVIASVLKPVDDTRAFEKMAISLAANGFEVFLIGQPTKSDSLSPDSIHFLPLQKFHRLSLSRWWARVKIFQKIHQVKPQILIVNTHELLIVAVANRILFGTKILYDIQENYLQNILLTKAFLPLIKPLIGGWVRAKEVLTSPLFHHYFLAEKSYQKELPFIGKKYSILENKLKLPTGFKRHPDPQKIRLIFTGTLAESTGIFQAIELAKNLHKKEPKIELLIVGFCARSNALNDIERVIETFPFIHLKGGKELVPHDEILEGIAASNFGIVAYPLSPHVRDKAPTKLFEYLGCQLPILLQNHSPWVELAARFNGAIALDFEQYDVDELLLKMQSTKFYSTSEDAQELLWASEEQKLMNAFTSLGSSLDV